MIFPVFREIVDNHEKENALNIVTDERTYQVFAESPEDARHVNTFMYRAYVFSAIGPNCSPSLCMFSFALLLLVAGLPC